MRSSVTKCKNKMTSSHTNKITRYSILCSTSESEATHILQPIKHRTKVILGQEKGRAIFNAVALAYTCYCCNLSGGVALIV